VSETRKLAAILVSDIVGYSRLAGADEDRILARLRTLRSDLIDPTIAVHHGRIIKSTGDGSIVEFRSVVDAVNCAIEVQRAMVERNAGVVPDKRIEFRIGIHLGDIVEESDGDLMGDGVNIAARLEGVAKPGAICLSEDAYRQVKARLDLAVNDLGATQLKNIAEPVRVYSLQVGPGAERKPLAAAAEKPSERPAAPTNRSIAVLAFNNMSGDPEQEYFSDGISEDIITDLSKLSELSVIARNSSFAYKGKPVDVKQVGRELGVHYVLEGSVRKAGGRVRVTGQLIDAASGAHIWADRFDRELTDIFAVQDELTEKITAALKINLTASERALRGSGGTKDADAHDLFLKGRELIMGNQRNRDAFEQSVACFQRAIEFDPNYAAPYAGLGMAYMLDHHNHWSEKAEKPLDEAQRFIDGSIARDDKDPYAHYVAALVAFWKKDLERSRKEADKALSLNPNHPQALVARGNIDLYSGDPARAIPYYERAIRLDPAQSQNKHFLALAYFVAGAYETAAAIFKERIALTPNTDLSRAFLASALGHLGRWDEAAAVWRELKEVNPRYSPASHMARSPFRDPADADRLIGGLRKAGLPEE
jgi:adenylate cyclase